MRYSLEKAFKDASEFGYDRVEIWRQAHAYPPDLKADGVSKIVEYSGLYDLPIIGFTPEMNMYLYNMLLGSGRMRKESMEYLKTSIDVAKDMGAEFTLIYAGHAGQRF